MPQNMDYCRFENTYQALRECQDVIDEVDDLDERETEARENLIALCKEIAEQFSEAE